MHVLFSCGKILIRVLTIYPFMLSLGYSSLGESIWEASAVVQCSGNLVVLLARYDISWYMITTHYHAKVQHALNINR